ncbi:phage tail assembly protein [uncultured Sphingomonas sp.]|uniref:phage tail assembly protein n=1 Tax=uncultured Sphingomonas sp. TaxID=158754 RepID=UPI0025FCD82A|nr:phage tail assembly protein [uncultured Sphingomonas sp.]
MDTPAEHATISPPASDDRQSAPPITDGRPPLSGEALPDTMTLTLRKPITFAGQPVTALELREPTAGQMKQWASLSGMAANIAAVSTVAGLPESVIGEIVSRDLFAAATFINSFGLIGAEAFDEPPSELTINLIHPIEHADQRYAQMSLREPTAGQLIEWDRVDGIEADLTIISAVSGVPLIALDKLRARDLVRAGSYLANFLAPGL